MSKYSYEEKLEAVLRVVEDGMSAKQSGAARHVLGRLLEPAGNGRSR